MIHVEQHGAVLTIRISRSFLGRPFWWTTVYWVDGVLIDAGPRFAGAALCTVLQKLPIDRLLLTHGHEDQIGGLPALCARYPQLKVYASARTLSLLRRPPCPQPFYRRLLWGTPQPWTGEVIALDEVENVIRTENYTLRAVETPGHTGDHIAYWEPNQRWLFSGDVYIHGKDDAWVAEADLFGVVCSLRTLASFHPERLFPSNGRVSRNPLPELHGKIGELLQLTNEVARFDALGLSTADMVLRLFQKEPPIHFWTMGHYSAVNLVEACRSYNALLMPILDRPPTPRLRPADEQANDDAPDSSDSPDSSSNWPIDWSDWMR